MATLFSLHRLGRWAAVTALAWPALSLAQALAQTREFQCPQPARDFPIYDHTATLLPNGDVLIAGGRARRNLVLGIFNCDPTQTLNTTWLYSTHRNTWSPAAPLAGRFKRFTSTLLPSGKVLLLAADTKAQLYDPASNAWTATGSANAAKQWGYTATLLPSGKLLIAGGLVATSRRPEETAQTKIYDPATNTWVSAKPMALARDSHTATLLPSGQVLVTGSPGDPLADGLLNGTDRAELYEPATDTWSPAGTMKSRHREPSATLLPSGTVLVVGKSDVMAIDGDAEVVSAELYNPQTNTWSPVSGPKAAPRSGHTATLLPSGKVLVAGGQINHAFATASAELYDPATDSWTSAGLMALGRYEHTATLLPNGKVLVVGGGGNENSMPDTHAELYDPASNSWAPTGPFLAKPSDSPARSK